jgi:hypothetical protein
MRLRSKPRRTLVDVATLALRRIRTWCALPSPQGGSDWPRDPIMPTCPMVLG